MSIAFIDYSYKVNDVTNSMIGIRIGIYDNKLMRKYDKIEKKILNHTQCHN